MRTGVLPQTPSLDEMPSNAHSQRLFDVLTRLPIEFVGDKKTWIYQIDRVKFPYEFLTSVSV